jgi:uncharacterized protein with HEPN domain
MKEVSLAHLHDIFQAARAIKGFVSGATFDDYARNELLRSAVERKFEIIGEALNRIKRDDPELLSLIPAQRDIISFRNILVHAYDAIDDRIVWGVVEDHLDKLLQHVSGLLQQG